MTSAAEPRLRFARGFAHRFVNPVTRLFAGWLPGFAILTHVGRRSGRTYSTPINVFRRRDHYLFALTYGSDVDWLKNVLAAGECEIRTGGRMVKLVDPELIVDPELRLMPWAVRTFLVVVARVTKVLRMRDASPRVGTEALSESLLALTSLSGLSGERPAGRMAGRRRNSRI